MFTDIFDFKLFISICSPIFERECRNCHIKGRLVFHLLHINKHFLSRLLLSHYVHRKNTHIDGKHTNQNCNDIDNNIEIILIHIDILNVVLPYRASYS